MLYGILIQCLGCILGVVTVAHIVTLTYESQLEAWNGIGPIKPCRSPGANLQALMLRAFHCDTYLVGQGLGDKALYGILAREGCRLAGQLQWGVEKYGPT